MKKLVIASTSTIHGSGYLEYILPELQDLFKGIEEIVFVPYARPSGIGHDAYTKIAQKAFETINIKVKGLHEFSDPVEGIKKARGIFTGGGNTFVLVNALYENNLLPVLKETVERGVPYLGTSAGSNICGVNMQTTNDMPIVYPPDFRTLEFIPFNINAHYLDPDPSSTHKGETRETRIKEFHVFNNLPVVGLREGSWLRVTGAEIILKGSLKARVFCKGETPQEYAPETDFGFLKGK